MDITTRSTRGRAASVAAVVAALVTLGIGDVAGASPPSTTTTLAPELPDTLDATVTLECGSTDATRIVSSFETSADPGQEVALFFDTPQSGGFLNTPVSVGDEVPVPPNLSWQIVGIVAGPWPVNSITDNCGSGAPGPSLAETGRGARSDVLAISVSLVIAGALLTWFVSRSRRPTVS